MRADRTARRARDWLVAVGVVHVVIGVAMPWLITLPPGERYLASLLDAFDVDADVRATALIAWLVVLLGAMIAGWGVLIAGLARAAHADRSRRPLDVLLAALVAWVVLDAGWAIAAGIWSHVVLDALAMLAIVPAILVLRRHVR